MVGNRNYNVLPHSYEYSFQSSQPTPIFQEKVGGLTRSWRCCISKELEKHRKDRGKEVVNLLEEVNTHVTEEETNKFMKLVKHSEYNID